MRERKSARPSSAALRQKKLYSALIHIYKLYQPEDLLSLKSDYFLGLCEARSIDWKLTDSFFQRDFLKPEESCPWPFCFSASLDYKSAHYGELLFFSSKKFLQGQKAFLKKISASVALALYFIKHKQKMENIKRDWSAVFNSFSQAFCITDKNHVIIRCNQSFQKITGQTEAVLAGKKLFDLFSPPAAKRSVEDKGQVFSDGRNTATPSREDKGQRAIWPDGHNVAAPSAKDKGKKAVFFESCHVKERNREHSSLDTYSAPYLQPQKGNQAGLWFVGVKQRPSCLAISHKPLFLRKENILAFLFLIKDVTEEMKIEAKLACQAKERELGLIKAGIAHELNNPIAGMSALLSVIEGQIPAEQTLAKGAVGEMRQAVHACQKIVGQLLSVSQESQKSAGAF